MVVFANLCWKIKMIFKLLFYYIWLRSNKIYICQYLTKKKLCYSKKKNAQSDLSIRFFILVPPIFQYSHFDRFWLKFDAETYVIRSFCNVYILLNFKLGVENSDKNSWISNSRLILSCLQNLSCNIYL